MKVVSISEAKNKLSALLRGLRSGEAVLIMDRGRAVARLESAASSTDDPEGRLESLTRRGLIEPGAHPLPAAFWESAPPHLEGDVSAVAVLLEERRGGP